MPTTENSTTAYCYALILQSRPDNANSVPGQYLCCSLLDLSKALADEMMKADDPEAISIWASQRAVYDFWTAALSSETVRVPNLPETCWYTNSESGDRVEISLKLV